MNPTKNQCIKWLSNPTINPITDKPIQLNKGTFNDLKKACQKHLSPNEVHTINKEAIKFIYPDVVVSVDTDTKIKKPIKLKTPIVLQDDKLDIKQEIKQPLVGIQPDIQPDIKPEIKSTIDPLKLPSKITFNISKLSEKNKILLSEKIVKKLATENELDGLIKTDDFIIQLLIAERKYLSYKIIRYNKVISQVESILNDPLLKLETGKSDVISALKDKMKSLKDNLEMITKRNENIGSLETFESNIIKDKREKITNILDDPINGTRTLIGESREDIRRSIFSKIISFAKAPELYINRFNNYTIMGGAGTGKTKLAGVFGNFFCNLGILNTNKVIIVTRADLVGQYIGETAPITRKYLDSTLEGVLFIDEAYQLSGCPENGVFPTNDFGSESITEIVNYIDKNIGLSVIIAAGYEDKIVDCFLKINEGMKRRFPNNIRLIDYTSEDLSNLLYYNIKQMFESQILTESQIEYINILIGQLNEKNVPSGKLFANQAGDMLNLSNLVIQDLILNQTKGYQPVNINDTMTKFFINKGLQVIIK